MDYNTRLAVERAASRLTKRLVERLPNDVIIDIAAQEDKANKLILEAREIQFKNTNAIEQFLFNR